MGAVATAAPAGPPAPYHPAPAAYAEPVLPPVYAYQYGVNDGYSGAAFSQSENRDHGATSGSYSVNLPDGRVQTVTYTVNDAHAGYVADVAYSGTAAYPPAPAPTYKKATA